jgi:GNAT superfamily N-acetyltransferase
MKNKIKIRQAKIEDIPQILEVEKAAWGEGRAATFEMFESRIKTFPHGNLVALANNKIIGVMATQIMNYDLEKNAFTWYEATDNGYIKKTHDPKGDTLYGVDLSVHPLYQNKGVGKKLMISVGKLAIKYNLKQGVLGARIPNYHKYADKIKVEDYVKINKNEKTNIPPDPELMFYQKLGLKIVKVIPNYFDDPESLNYGVLMVWKNPFYNKWYRWIAAKFFKV